MKLPPRGLAASVRACLLQFAFPLLLVSTIVSGDDSQFHIARISPVRVKALAAEASLRVKEDPDAALRLIDEAIAMTDKLPWWHTSARDALWGIRARVERVRSGRPDRLGLAIRKLAGTYLVSWGLEAHTLILRRDGSFLLRIRGDTGDSSVIRGRFEVEVGRVVLTPGRWLRMSGLDAPDVLVPVPWGDRIYLLYEWQWLGFCNQLNGGWLDAPAGVGFKYYVLQRSGKVPTGLPDLPPEWRLYLLASPCEAKVITVEPGGNVVAELLTGNGLKVGMWLHGNNLRGGSSGQWRVLYVGHNVTYAVPNNPRIARVKPGDRLCTRPGG